MPGRSPRNSVILAKIETTSGTDAAPSATTDAVLYYAQGLECSVRGKFVDRDVVRVGFGAPDKLMYARRGTISYSVDLAGSGAAGTAPPWSRLLQSAGFAEALTAASRAELTPVSTGIKTLTHWANWDGVNRKFVYCAPSAARLRFKAGEIPMLDLAFQALVIDLPAAAALPTPTQTAWKTPQAVGALYTQKVILGGTYSAGVVSVASGAAYDMSEANFDLAPSLQDADLATAEAIDVDGRNPTASIVLQATAAQEAAFHGMLGSTMSIGVQHGTVAGNKAAIFAQAGRLTAVEDVSVGNKLLTRLEFSLPPVAAAGDEIRIVSL